MPGKWRPGVIGRAAGRRRSVRRPTPQPVVFERLLDVRIVDRLLDQLLRWPRWLMVVVALIGLLLIALDLETLMWPLSAPRAPTTAAALVANSIAATPTPLGVSLEQEALAVVTSYNQASITAAVLGKVEPMAPYLAPEGSAWAAVQAEYRRRATRGETHDPALRRWGVLRIAVDGGTATVETQEQWDDIASVGGQVISSQRGILMRNTYALRRSPGAGHWLITTVSSALISR